VRKLDRELDRIQKHCRLLSGLVENPETHLAGVQKSARDAKKAAEEAAVRHGKLWQGVRAVTAKLPREQRQTLRRDIERELAQVEDRIRRVEKAAVNLLRKVNRARNNNQFQGSENAPLLTFLNIVALFYKQWRQNKRKALEDKRG
jgi:hypothetical protein